jgi:hypothetical protein
LKTYYTRSGINKTQKASAVALNEIYRLYLPQVTDKDSWQSFVYEFVDRTLHRTSALLSVIGQKRILEYAITGFSPAEIEKVCTTVALFSILLWHLNIRKEDYVMNVPYNIGQFLQLADMLHKEYCFQVRNGGNRNKPLPAQLIGNELLPVALDNPNECLKRLSERMRVYLAWANTSHGEGTGLAKWILARYGEVCLKIAGREVPSELDPPQQAQLFLGYLATVPYEKKEVEINE